MREAHNLISKIKSFMGRHEVSMKVELTAENERLNELLMQASSKKRAPAPVPAQAPTSASKQAPPPKQAPTSASKLVVKGQDKSEVKMA